MKIIKNFAWVLVFFGFQLAAQEAPPKDWFNQDPSSGYNGVSTEKTYGELLNNKKGETVIVAVIDSGVDHLHEDLKDIMWVNPGEIPNNGIDDDKNGYIDDIHGWNFIGGPDGREVTADTYEVTRLYAKYKYKYENAVPSTLTKKQKEEYEKFLVYKKEVESKRESAEKNMAGMDENAKNIYNAVDEMAKALGSNELNLANVEALDNTDNQPLAMAQNIYKQVIQANPDITDIKGFKDFIADAIEDGKKRFKDQLEYAYNPDFDTRDITQDNYADSYERNYGNNNVKGPDASHGTHVAGIIAAVRNNGIGMDGVADNVQIMSVRTVPDGDERDKDVANAIIYAVDNGASIINMSFGKGYSWDKEAVDKALRYAQKNDVLMVHAAGNSAQDNDVRDSNFPNDRYEKKGLFRKRHANNWLEVGALNYRKGEDSPAPFSNYGADNVDLFAPGMAIYSTIPEDGYASFQGTSMASPVVAGVAAVLRSYYPKLSAKQVKEILLETVVPQDIQVYKPGTKELVNFSDLSVTGGVVNLYKAVQKAQTVKGKSKSYKKKAKFINKSSSKEKAKKESNA